MLITVVSNIGVIIMISRVMIMIVISCNNAAIIMIDAVISALLCNQMIFNFNKTDFSHFSHHV